MRQGKCKLCLKRKHLQNSHLIPASIYRIILRDQGSPPVLVTKKRARTSSRQVTAHELCWHCEQLLRQRGEDWTARQVFQGTAFPLLDRLSLAVPDWQFPDHTAYSGIACGLDTERLVYFGASVLWRSSLRAWTIGDSQTTTIDLGPLQDRLRRYLVGSAPFPPDGVAVITVCTDFASQGCFSTPCAIRDGIVQGYSVHILGVNFRFFFGPGVPASFFSFCCVHSGRGRLVVADHSKQSYHSIGHLLRAATESRNLGGQTVHF